MEHKQQVRVLEPAQKYLDTLPESEQGAVQADLRTMENEQTAMTVKTKQLRGPIRELIVGHHRFTYFKVDTTLYFVRGFRKKTNKTPRQEIEYAENIYRQLSK